MQFCRKCGVSINGSKKCCPLCQRKLIGTPEPTAERYPRIPAPRFTRYFVFKIITFAAVTISVISYAINLVVTPDFKWSIIIGLASLCLWAASSVAIWYRRKIIKNIMWELILITPMCIAWDFNTGWHKWSLNFVFPCLCAAAITASMIIVAVMKYRPQEYVIYLFVEVVCGIIPFILVLTNITTIALPSVICSAISILSLVSMFLFIGKNTGNEVKRKFHI